jgi:hypothetical protein
MTRHDRHEDDPLIANHARALAISIRYQRLCLAAAWLEDGTDHDHDETIAAIDARIYELDVEASALRLARVGR